MVADVRERKKMNVHTLCLAIALSLLACGCKTTSDIPKMPAKQAKIEIKDVTTKGVVIIRFGGEAIHYQKTCEFCGFVSPLIIGTAFPEAPWTCRSTFVCPKCDKTTDVVIQRTR